MTTFVRSYRDENILVGVITLVAASVVIRVPNSRATLIAVAVEVFILSVGVWLNLQPKRELRISADEIVLATKAGVTARIGHAEAGGTVAVLKKTVNGGAWLSLVAPTPPGAREIPLEGFRFPKGALAAACMANGWELVP